jgi:hypothetical protein
VVEILRDVEIIWYLRFYLLFISYTYVELVRSGDVIYMNVFGVSLVIIGSLDAANNFFEKRSAINSDRPRAAMINVLCVFFLFDFGIRG